MVCAICSIGTAAKRLSDFPFPFIQVTDDAILIMLRKSNDPYIALTYYTTDAGNTITELEEKGVQFSSKPKPGDPVRRFLLQSPDGMNISIVEMLALFDNPAGKTILTMNQADYMKPGAYTNQTAGMFGEFAQTVADLEQSIAFWEKLGFKTLTKYSSPHPWAILADGIAVVGLHQSQEFNSVTITFFAADMKTKIDNLKKQGLSFKDMGPGNAELTTPEDQKIFLFNMGM